MIDLNSAASQSLRGHNQQTDRLDSSLLLAPLASGSLIEVSLDPLAPRLANALLPQAIPPQMQQQGSLHMLISLINLTNKLILRPYLILCTDSTPSQRRRRLPCNARTLANSYSFSAPTMSRSATTSRQDTCSVNAKPLNLWSFEQHRSHAKHDRKHTAHVCLDKHQQAHVTLHTPLAHSACVQAAQCVPTQTFTRL